MIIGKTLSKILDDIVMSCFWYTPRTVFELIYCNKDECKKLKPEYSNLIDKICEAKSQQEFLRVLKNANSLGSHIGISEIDGELYII